MIYTRPIRRLRAGAAAALLISLLSACAGGDEQGFHMPPPEVSVANPRLQSVTTTTEYSGIIEAVDAVELRPRVGGYLDKVHFVEGAQVSRGDLLFSIDDREYRAARDSAAADLARADARVHLARQERQRSADLLASRAVSQGELDARDNELRQAEADQAAAKARLQQAELTLGFTRIHAPVAGRIGAALIKPGNLLNPDQSVLATLVSIDPIRMAFDGGTVELLPLSGTPTAVRVAVGANAQSQHDGELDFVDNAINPATGTVHARVSLANPDGRLVPGMFARVQVPTRQLDSALLIHPNAIQVDQDRRFVYVIGEGNTAQRRDIALGAEVNGLRVVDSGLESTDQVIVNGSRKIFFPGQPVAPRTVPMDDPEQPAPAASVTEADKG